MSIQRFISTQNNEYFSTDYNFEFPKSSVQDLVDQQLQYSSSSSMISCIGSPSSAFFATERCLGLTQYDVNEDSTSQLIKNYDLQMSSFDPQQCKNGTLEDSLAQSEPDFRYKISLPSFIRTEFSTSPFSDVSESEKESLLHLQNELLGELDTSYRKHPSLPFDGYRDYSVST